MAGVDALQRISISSAQHHEEEASELEKAALERIHAKRLAAKEAVLVKDDQGRWQLVKLRKLNASSKSLLLSRVYRQTEDEGLGFFARVRERLDRANLPEAAVEIRFKNLSVRGTQIIKAEEQGLLGKLKALNPLAAKQRVKKWNIIDGVSGVLKPGRLTLLLGTPGSGRSVLMKALAGRLGQEKTLKVSYDELTYDGQGMDSFVPERTAIYVSQLDNHFGELTVRQTLEFSARVQGGRRELLELLEQREKELGITPDPDIQSYMRALAAGGKHNLVVDVMLRTLGLDICADTLVGNHMIRGISGGQKKRVTGGEMLVGPAKVLFADEISTGLDSATTHDIVQAMRRVTRYMQSTMLVALLQPAPETLELFDDIMVLSSGKIIFHGPREGVLPFFEGLGFHCPERKGIAEFLQEVPTLADQQRFWAGNPAEWKFMSAQEIADQFYKTTEEGRNIMRALEVPFEVEAAGTNANSDISTSALIKSKYGAGAIELARACLRRGLWQLHGNLPMHMGRLIQTILLSFVVGTLFLKEDKGLLTGPDGQPNVTASLSSANNFLGVLFFTVINFMVASFPDSALLVEALPVWYKHRAANFYPAWCFALQNVVMRLPWVFAESWVWTLMIYFCVGFVTSVRVLAFWAISFGIGCFSLTLFLASGSLMRKVPSANALQATFLLLFVNTCGFVINKNQIPGGWNGVYWSNPMQYYLTGLSVNEMTSSDWSEVVPGTNQTIGQLALESRGIKQSYDYVWVAIFVWGAAACCINFGALVFFLNKMAAPKDPIVVSEEAYAVQVRSRTGIDAEAVLAELAESKCCRKSASSSAESSPRMTNGTVASGRFKKVASGAALDVEAQKPQQVTALPFKPMTMTFKDVRYSVPFPKDAARDETNTGEGPHANQLILLKGISGSFRPGILTALMGASGAGKTTLMDVLAGRKTGGVITGDIRVNGHPKVHKTFARVSGYVEQTDIHVPFATVHEALQLSARLRLPSHISQQKEKTETFVREIMDLIELTPIADSMVGLPGGGLSVEQRKRLTIAVELVANPSIVFMDEPTSGLDARGAGLVMRAVKATVNTGRTVVCTIHQPSLEIFSEFQELLLLKRGGETIFSGAIGADAHNLISYFSSIDGVQAIKPRINPANWMLEVTSPEAEKQTGVDFAELYAGSQLAAAADAMVAKHSEPLAGEEPLRMQDLNMVSGLVQTVELTRRNFQELMRDFSYNGIRTFITLAIAICLATLYANQGQEVGTYGGVLNASGAMYAGSTFVAVMYLFTVQDSLVLRRTVFYREYAAGTFNVIPYWVAELLAEVPFLIANAMAYSLISYFAIGFIADAAKFFWYFLMVLLTLFTFVSFGMMSVHITPNLEISNAFSAFAFSLINLMSGFIKPKDAIPGGWIWLYYLDPASYSLYGMVANQLGDVDTMMQLPPGSVPAEVPVSAFVESYFGFKHSFFGWCALILIAFTVFFRLIALLALKRLNFQQR